MNDKMNKSELYELRDEDGALVVTTPCELRVIMEAIAVFVRRGVDTSKFQAVKNSNE